MLRVARGAGTRGLAGIYPKISSQSSVLSSQSPELSTKNREPRTIIRPLLGVRRKELEQYLNSIGQSWREDSSNRDLRHARNRVRHGILPRLERNLNPAIREALAETAEIARAEEDYWEDEVARVLPSAQGVGRGDALLLPELLALPLALQRRVVRAVAEKLELRLEFRQVEEILAVGAGEAKSVELAGRWRASRHKLGLQFERGDASPAAQDYEYPLAVPGRVKVEETGQCIEALLISGGERTAYNPDHLLDAALVSKELTVRNWRAGDRFWPAHSKSAKKIKELLQERHLTGLERKLWPVVASGDEVVWVRGLAPQPAGSGTRAESSSRR